MNAPRSALSRFASLGLALALSACGGSVVTPIPLGDASPDRPDVQSPCALGNGQVCPRGSSCPSPDGCNTCFCDANGLLACTARACVDAGPPGCTLPNGSRCAVGQTCPAGDGCNVCACGEGGILACTGAVCVDAGFSPDAAVCAGAAVHPISGCLGPDDGPLPDACCRGWPCDPNLVACDARPPTCPPGHVAAVLNQCWGPCVPREHCASR